MNAIFDVIDAIIMGLAISFVFVCLFSWIALAFVAIWSIFRPKRVEK